MSLMNSLMNDQGMGRRMLVYLLIDTSGSMHGAPIQAVNQGIESLVRNLKSTPEAVEMVNLCIVTFSSAATETGPLKPLLQFQVPTLQCGGGTNMAAGLELVNQLIDRDFHPNRGGQVRGDYKPMVIMLTDGDPTISPNSGETPVDAAVRAGQAIQNRPSGKTVGTFLALGCGPDVNVDVLKRVASTVAMMQHMTDDNLKKFFQWVTASIATASRAASRPAGEEGGAVDAPEVPNDEKGQPVMKFEF